MEKVYSTHTLIDRLPSTICSFRKTFYFSLDFTFLSYFGCYSLRSWVDFNLNMFQIFKKFQTNFYFIYTFSLSLSLFIALKMFEKETEWVRTHNGWNLWWFVQRTMYIVLHRDFKSKFLYKYGRECTTYRFSMKFIAENLEIIYF